MVSATSSRIRTRRCRCASPKRSRHGALYLLVNEKVSPEAAQQRCALARFLSGRACRSANDNRRRLEIWARRVYVCGVSSCVQMGGFGGSDSTDPAVRGSAVSNLVSHWYLAAGPILAVGVLSMTAFAGSLSVGKQINQAVRAPYEDFARRDAAAFCGDFTPTVAAEVVVHAPANSTCATAVAEMFALTAPYQPRFSAILPADWKVTNVVRHGDHVSALFHYGKQGSASFALRRISGRWLFATRARLIAVAGCGGHIGAKGCPPGAHILIALIGVPTIGHVGCPESRSGGSTLSTRRIERALIDPSEPMPSFTHLPKGKFRALVRFLSLLR